MDLEGFNDTDESLKLDLPSKADTIDDALRVIDALWYRPASRRARFMDLLGDYAGSERFVIEGA